MIGEEAGDAMHVRVDVVRNDQGKWCVLEVPVAEPLGESRRAPRVTGGQSCPSGRRHDRSSGHRRLTRRIPVALRTKRPYRGDVETAQSPTAGDRPVPDLLADPARVAAVERIIAAEPSSRCVQRLTTLAARLLDAPCAQVSLLSHSEQFVAAAVGVPGSAVAPRTPALESMCSITVALARPFVVEDAAGHPWVQDLPPVTSGLVSSYLGVVLTDSPGHILGSLCVYGSDPRTWTDADVESLTALAEAVADELEDAAAG